MPDKIAVAQLTDTVVGLLTSYVTRYKTQKAQKDLEFILNQCELSEQKFQLSQKNLAEFRDQNKNVISALAKTKEEQLQAEFNLAFNLYSGLEQKMEQAKIKVQEQTPVFKIIEPPKVPLRPTPMRLLIILFSGIVGLLLSLMVILKKEELSLKLKRLFEKTPDQET